MKKAGTTTFHDQTPEEKAEWTKAMQPVIDEMSSRVGKGLIEEFQKEANAKTN